MRRVILVHWLAFFWVASFFLLCLTRAGLCDGWKQNYRFSSNNELQSIGAQYSFFTTEKSDGSKKGGILRGGAQAPYSIDDAWMLSIETRKTLAQDRSLPFVPGIGFFAKYATAQVNMPKGYGNFVDPVRVHSTAIILGTSIFLRSQKIGGKIVFETGAEMSRVHSRELFELGSWRLHEATAFSKANLYGRLEIDIAKQSSKMNTYTPAAYFQINHSQKMTQMSFGFQVQH